MADPQLNRRILIIDDSEAIHADYHKVLELPAGADECLEVEDLEDVLLGRAERTTAPTFKVESAYQGEHGVAMAKAALLEGHPYAMAFVDMRMPPGWDGLRTIEELWAIDSHIQVVICSAHADYEWAEVVERLQHSDRLLVLRKPFEPIEVQQCASALCHKWHNERIVRGQVESLERVVAARTHGLEAANEQLRHIATHDVLTGLPNRALLDDRLHQMIAQGPRNAQPFAVLMCDLDRFKLINDSMGHRAGDAFLQSVASRLTEVIRTGDTLARRGGDEFVFLVNSPIDGSDAQSIAQRALQVLDAPVRIDGIDIHVAASIGIAMYPRDGDRADILLANADAAMYSAKQRGSNLIEQFSPEMRGLTPHRLQLESDLHRALELQQFELHYQPKVDTNTGMVRSAEALVRWRHPERGLLGPTEFIAIAESSGQIVPLGEWVLNEACRQARKWQDEGLPPLRIGVNVSAAQFRQGELVRTVEQALDAAGLEPHFLELELTESAVMRSPEESVAILEELSSMGILVSVDDFGTGYSSMSYLRRFPIDKLKIDKSFVCDMVARAEDASIVQAIISLAHSLKLKVVAEGVETGEQLAVLKSLGCDQYQGFHFCCALPANEFKALMKAQDAGIASRLEPVEPTQSKLTALRQR
ncbi:MAG: EAL domain-containing protein [Steroidobacteraceae bacterium]